MQRFTDLKVWQRSHALALQVYAITKTFPDDKRYGLTSQLRRAAVSIPSNIVEGAKRQTAGDYARFLNLAEGSAAEVEYLVILARDLGYLSTEATESLLADAEKIARMLFALRKMVEAGPDRR
jgi:four helix bundle protein